MKKNKSENKIVLCMLLLTCLLTVVPAVPSHAGWLDFGWETLEFTDEEDKDTDELCNLNKDITEAKNKGKWWKTPLETALKAALGVGEAVFTNVAPGAKRLMFVGAGLWLAWFTLQVVGRPNLSVDIYVQLPCGSLPFPHILRQTFRGDIISSRR